MSSAFNAALLSCNQNHNSDDGKTIQQQHARPTQLAFMANLINALDDQDDLAVNACADAHKKAKMETL